MYQTDSTSSNLSDPDSLRSLLITNLRLELLKFHPFTGIDADIQDPQIAVRQFYAIYNIEVLGWCFCNGLENNCSFSNKELAVPGMVSQYIGTYIVRDFWYFLANTSLCL